MKSRVSDTTGDCMQALAPWANQLRCWALPNCSLGSALRVIAFL